MTSTPSGWIGMDAEVLTFVDTNVLVYAHDRSDAQKQVAAQEILERLWADGTGTLSTQVLQEVYVVATSKQKLAMSHQEARDLVEAYSAWPVIVVEPALILTASRLAEDHRLSFWDALIVEAARVAGAERLLTEDLQHGQMFDGVRIENPFATDARRQTVTGHPPGGDRIGAPGRSPPPRHATTGLGR